jgi:DUF4097 and DUF4098 domain-containing protein YvlB
MKPTTKIVIIAVLAIALAAFALICASAFLNTAFTPLAQRQDKTSYTPKENVEIQATTFNGDVHIEASTGNQIEVIYDIQAPEGHLYDVKTMTNETKSDNLTILITLAANQGSEIPSVNHRADILIKVPNTSIYNLTLTTLNGNIIKPQLNDVNVVASTSNGYVDIKDDHCKNINASSLNGNIKIGLAQGTLFQVDASVANGNVAYQGIAMNTSVQSTTELKGATSAGQGNLNLMLSTANGQVTIEYLSG